MAERHVMDRPHRFNRHQNGFVPRAAGRRHAADGDQFGAQVRLRVGGGAMAMGGHDTGAERQWHCGAEYRLIDGFKAPPGDQRAGQMGDKIDGRADDRRAAVAVAKGQRGGQGDIGVAGDLVVESAI